MRGNLSIPILEGRARGSARGPLPTAHGHAGIERDEFNTMDRDDDQNPSSHPSPTPSINGLNCDPARSRRVLVPRASQARPKGWRTEDEELLNRPLPELPQARSPELAAFTHTDPWRVLRIQGEFVHGINALAEVGAAVAVFGSARFDANHPHYAAARALGRALAEAGFAVIT